MRYITLLTVGLMAFALSACNDKETTAASEESAPAAEESSNEAMASDAVAALYEVHDEGRINIFYDRPLYESYLEVRETPFRLTQIGSGPNGETIVYGLTKDDKKKGIDTPAAMLMEGKAKAADDFYGEMRKEGRIYVFSTVDDMAAVRQFGHPNFFFTEIGAGPDGETVVYVLNSSNKKEHPAALVERFKAENS